MFFGFALISVIFAIPQSYIFIRHIGGAIEENRLLKCHTTVAGNIQKEGKTMYADIQMMNSVFAASIDASAKIVLFAIIYHANKETHEAFPSWRTLMDETSLSRSTVMRSIKQLVEAGFIS